MSAAPCAAPALPVDRSAGRLRRCHALLIDPCRPKGEAPARHALTEVAGATPPGWTVRVWDDNLSLGPPPADPVPQVVGVFLDDPPVERAEELAASYRAHGAVVVLLPRTGPSCPGEAERLWVRALVDVEAGRADLRPAL
jgi:hypothetical protein